MSKILFISASVVMMYSIIIDATVLSKKWSDMKNLDNYFAFENENLKKEKQQIIKRIQTTLAFRNSNWEKEFQAFGNLETKSIANLEMDLLLLNPGIDSLDDLPFYNGDILDARKRMRNAKQEDIREYYRTLYYIPLLEWLESYVSYYPCIMFLPKFELIRPVTEDSTYIASIAFAERSKIAFRINGLYFKERRDMYYQIPKADTIYIETLDISHKGTYIDTAITFQALTKVGGRWRNIGSRKGVFKGVTIEP